MEDGWSKSRKNHKKTTNRFDFCEFECIVMGVMEKREFSTNHKEFVMDGNRAFEYLSQMTEDERKAVRLLWFDEEMLDSLPSVDEEKYIGKCQFFDSLSNEEKGELIERGLYTQNGDFTRKHSEFLDNFAERFDNAIDAKMQMATH